MGHWNNATVKTCLLLGLALGMTGSASALDITDGDVVVENLGSYGFTDNQSVLSFDDGTTDQLYQMFGYLGTGAGASRINASSFDVLTTISNTGPIATSVLELSSAGASALGLGLGAGDIRIEYTFELVNDQTAADLDGFNWDFSITNLSGADLDISFYAYLDLDLDGVGDFGDDIATADYRQIIVTDSDSPTVYHWNASNSGLADHFEVKLYPEVRNDLDGLTSNTDLTDSGATFGPGDFSAAYQYDFSIADGASVSNGLGSISPIPEPSTAMLLLVGLVGLGRSRARAATHQRVS